MNKVVDNQIIKIHMYAHNLFAVYFKLTGIIAIKIIHNDTFILHIQMCEAMHLSQNGGLPGQNVDMDMIEVV